jgi:16S rRNA (guanine(966)-N(2))-methyltransferase RsmD
LFNSLGGRIEGTRVLDLYAGTGALGRGALQRGAASALFVEHNAPLAADLRRHLAADGVAASAEVWSKDALAAIRDLGTAQRSFDIIFMDPPYGQELIAATLEAITRAGILAPDGLVAAEGHWRDHPGEIAGLTCRREARYGETRLWYFQNSGGDRR